jgi:hypothetical protein
MGMIPVENEVDIIWCNGRDRVRAKLLIKATERPLQSRVFLGSRDPMASDTSDKVTGSREKLKRESSGTWISGTSGGVLQWSSLLSWDVYSVQTLCFSLVYSVQTLCSCLVYSVQTLCSSLVYSVQTLCSSLVYSVQTLCSSLIYSVNIVESFCFRGLQCNFLLLSWLQRAVLNFSWFTVYTVLLLSWFTVWSTFVIMIYSVQSYCCHGLRCVVLLLSWFTVWHPFVSMVYSV